MLFEWAVHICRQEVSRFYNSIGPGKCLEDFGTVAVEFFCFSYIVSKMIFLGTSFLSCGT